MHFVILCRNFFFYKFKMWFTLIRHTVYVCGLTGTWDWVTRVLRVKFEKFVCARNKPHVFCCFCAVLFVRCLVTFLAVCVIWGNSNWLWHYVTNQAQSFCKILRVCFFFVCLFSQFLKSSRSYIFPSNQTFCIFLGAKRLLWSAHLRTYG